MKYLVTALLGTMFIVSIGGGSATAADLDREYAPPPGAYAPPVAYAPRVVIESPGVVVPQPYVYPRPYLYPRPYAYVRHVPPFYGPYRRFAYGPRYRGWYRPGWYR